jgi:hypothetical protein
MLDTYVLRQAPAYPQEINKRVTEVRAPTDDSVKLLREMEQQAREETDKMFVWRGNTVNGTVRCHTDTWSGAPVISAHYEINGQKYTVTLSPDADDWFDWRGSNDLARSCFKFLITNMAKHTAEQMMRNWFEPIVGCIRGR